MTVLKSKFTYEVQKEVKLDGQKVDKCSICCTGFEKGENKTTIPKCGHSFHFDCIEVWLKTQSTCPCCRENIRKGMIEHYHGDVAFRGEQKILQKVSSEKTIIANDLSVDVSLAKGQHINKGLVSSAYDVEMLEKA